MQSDKGLSENLLIRALKEGKTEAVGTLVATYRQRLLRSAFLLCGLEQDAEDMVQEAFFQAMRSIGNFKGKSSLYTWLYAIMVNIFRQRLRKKKSLSVDGSIMERFPAARVDQEKNLDRQKVASALQAGLQTLSGNHREVVVLRYYDGLKIEEISVALGISKGTVKSRLHYAARQIKKNISPDLNLFHGNVTN
ncbi:MAG: RNA polymerase sigma factor [bacterium]|nr:RNA polymerase sigma factor [bacterium]